MSTRAIVLAAGKGTRMRSDRPKVLHEIAGRSLLGWALDVLGELDLAETVVVVGHEADSVASSLPEGVGSALQDEQLGTGHAARVGLDALRHEDGDTVLVIPGDMPLLRGETLQALLDLHENIGAAASLMTAVLDDPTGYGRIIRHDDAVARIVEQGDASEEELEIREVCTSVYAFSADDLRRTLDKLGTDNSKGEYYLTDVVGLIADSERPVAALAASAGEAQGVNSYDQMAKAAAAMRERINHDWMQEGVSMIDPARVYLDATVVLTPGVRLLPEVHLVGETTVGQGAEIGPSVHAADSQIGANSRVWYSVLRGAVVGTDVSVGPYASLREGTELLAQSKAGTFVEVKNSQVGKGSKVPHLSYVGDTTIGEDSNIGAGTITVNYDGFKKHRTTIGDRVKVGSDTMLVAPVELGDDSYTGAGSVITKDVSPGALAIERSPQREIEDYSTRRRRRRAEKERD